MALTYSSFVSEIATLTAITSAVLVNGDNNFSGIMPALIDYAEGRLYRELDLISASVTDTSVSCSSGERSILLSTTRGTLLAIEGIDLFIPAGATSADGTRVSLVPASKAVIDAIYPSAKSSNCGLPEFFGRIGDTRIIFGPVPDQAYATQVQATIRPNPLSDTNSSTWLTQNLPELMIAAGMIFAAGHMRDFGAQSDDPKMAQSWEAQYGNLMKSASVDSMRQKFESVTWTSQSPTPLAPRA